MCLYTVNIWNVVYFLTKDDLQSDPVIKRGNDASSFFVCINKCTKYIILENYSFLTFYFLSLLNRMLDEIFTPSMIYHLSSSIKSTLYFRWTNNFEKGKQLIRSVSYAITKSETILHSKCHCFSMIKNHRSTVTYTPW